MVGVDERQLFYIAMPKSKQRCWIGDKSWNLIASSALLGVLSCINSKIEIPKTKHILDVI